MRRIEMLKMPGMLEREHGDERDCREQIERKKSSHAEQQDRQHQSQTEYGRWIRQR